MNILNNLRFVLKDKSDEKYSKDEKIKIANDNLDTLSNYIPETKIVYLSNKLNSLKFDLPSDLLDIEYVENIATTFDFTNTVVAEAIDTPEDYIIVWNELTYRNNNQTLNLPIDSVKLKVTYLAKFAYLIEDEILWDVEIWDTNIIVADTSKYSVWEDILIGDELTEEEVKITAIVDETNITVKALKKAHSVWDRIIWDAKLDNDDKKTLEYSAQTYVNNLDSNSQYKSFRWKTDNMEEAYDKGDMSVVSGNTPYGAFMMKIKSHRRYRFYREKVMNYQITL